MKRDAILKIKKANKDNISEIVEIHKACVSKTNAKSYSKSVIKEWLTQISEQNVLYQMNKTIWLVLIKDDNTIGFCQYDIEGGELYQMQILPKHQGKGYGKYLYAFIEKVL